MPIHQQKPPEDYVTWSQGEAGCVSTCGGKEHDAYHELTYVARASDGWCALWIARRRYLSWVWKREREQGQELERYMQP